MSKNTPDYGLLAAQIQSLMDGEPHWITALSNASALLMETLDGVNWIGFYLRGSFVDSRLSEDELILGPFQGKVACSRIPFGSGVCGTAAQLDETQCVEDVHAFPGHIACDAASRSELVVPLHTREHVVGVLDIDSPRLARFVTEDKTGLERVARVIERVF